MRLAPKKVSTAVLAILLFAASASTSTASRSDLTEKSVRPCVVLLHGLARTASSMQDLADALSVADYHVVNVDYKSRSETIEVLAELAVGRGLTQCAFNTSGEVNFVTHSLGGILVRQYLLNKQIPNLGRVVMLAPPNNGSEVVDEMIKVPGVEWYNGPSFEQLSVDEHSAVMRLGKVEFDLGVIAGTRTVNYILSQFLPNPDDGKVSVESTKVEGMCGFLTVPSSHTFIMNNDVVIEQVQAYLQTGAFNHPDAEAIACDQ